MLHWPTDPHKLLRSPQKSSGVCEEYQESARSLQGVLRSLQGLLRSLQGVLRSLQGVLRSLQGVLRSTPLKHLLLLTNCLRSLQEFSVRSRYGVREVSQAGALT